MGVSRMERPTWVTIVGVIGIVLGIFGLLAAVQWLSMPWVMQFQQAMISDMTSQTAGSGANPPDQFFELFRSLTDLPQWYTAWSVVAALMSFVVIGYYIFAAIQLLQVNPKAIRAFYIAACVWIGVSALKALVAFGVSFLLGVFTIVGVATGVVLNIVLMYLIHTSDKSCFFPDLNAEAR